MKIAFKIRDLVDELQYDPRSPLEVWLDENPEYMEQEMKKAGYSEIDRIMRVIEYAETIEDVLDVLIFMGKQHRFVHIADAIPDAKSAASTRLMELAKDAIWEDS